ncbi:MAG: hypothetical protein WKF57_08310 [Nakamurella sp.]
MRISRRVRIGLVGVVAALAPVVVAMPAHATVTIGQSLKPVSKYECGHTIAVTGESGIGEATLYQVSMIYRHCGTGSLRRKSDVLGSVGFDGKCMTIGAGQAIVIDARYVAFARQTCNGVVNC